MKRMNGYQQMCEQQYPDAALDATWLDGASLPTGCTFGAQQGMERAASVYTALQMNNS